MEETDFNRAAEAALKAVADALDASDLDCDAGFKSEGVLEIEFEDGTRMVVNRHSAAREIWVAAKSGGFHFRLQDGEWRDTRGGRELFAALSALISETVGSDVELKA